MRTLLDAIGGALLLVASPIGCAAPPLAADLRAYMRDDPAYGALPTGPARVDALFLHACELTGSPNGAIELLGGLSLSEGIELRHPFNTGLAVDGPLSRNDRTGHFFVHAMWRSRDRASLIHVGSFNAIAWEVLGELKSWFTGGDGWDWHDLWANALGREFADRLATAARRGDRPPMPSEVLRVAAVFRPAAIPAEDDSHDPAVAPGQVAHRAAGEVSANP